jgi:RNA polymerase sigma-70 factor, ECF subfamily
LQAQLKFAPLTEHEFIQAIQTHAGVIHKILYLYLDDKEEREDMAQEIQLQAWKSIHRFEGKSLFSTWLYRVALNTVFAHNRKKRILTAPIETREFTATEDETSDQSHLLFRAIKGLSDTDKTIILLHLEDYDNGEIAEITGMTKNNIGVKLHRIKEALTQKLNPQPHG